MYVKIVRRLIMCLVERNERPKGATPLNGIALGNNNPARQRKISVKDREGTNFLSELFLTGIYNFSMVIPP